MIHTGMITQLPCQQKRLTSILAGGFIAAYGYDTMLPLPRAAHYAAAGLLVDVTCRGPDAAYGELAWSAGLGVVGAYAIPMLGKRLNLM